MSTISTTYDTIIIGGGVIGCSAAFMLARQGQRVLLLEQFAIGHNRGSSHGPSRIFRIAYPASHYLLLAQAALTLWREIEQEAQTPLLLQTGGLDISSPNTSTLDTIRDTLQHKQIPHELLPHESLAQRFPQFNLPAGTSGIFQPDAGVLLADVCVHTFARLARRFGAHLLENTRVQQLKPTGAGCEIVTDSGLFHAKRTIVCAGPWTRPLLNPTGIDLPLRVQREQVAYFTVCQSGDFAPDRFPVFLHHIGRPNTYGFPLFGTSTSMKIAFHGGGTPVDTPDSNHAVQLSSLETLRSYVIDLLPGVSGEIELVTPCYYTMTPDEDFIIDHHPRYPQIIISSTCSGHGFKFASVIGQILAELATSGQSHHDIEAFSLKRFPLASQARSVCFH